MKTEMRTVLTALFLITAVALSSGCKLNKNAAKSALGKVSSAISQTGGKVGKQAVRHADDLVDAAGMAKGLITEDTKAARPQNSTGKGKTAAAGAAVIGGAMAASQQKVYVDDNTYFIPEKEANRARVVMIKGNITEKYVMDFYKNYFVVRSVSADNRERNNDLQGEVNVKQYYEDNPRTAKVARKMGII